MMVGMNRVKKTLMLLNVLFCLYVVIATVFISINNHLDFGYNFFSRMAISIGASIISIIYISKIEKRLITLQLKAKVLTAFFVLGHAFFVIFGSYMYYYELSKSSTSTTSSLSIVCAMLFLQTLYSCYKKTE